MVEKTPGPHVNDMWDCGAFNQTKILTEWKGKSEELKVELTNEGVKFKPLSSAEKKASTAV